MFMKGYPHSTTPENGLQTTFFIRHQISPITASIHTAIAHPMTPPTANAKASIARQTCGIRTGISGRVSCNHLFCRKITAIYSSYRKRISHYGIIIFPCVEIMFPVLIVCVDNRLFRWNSIDIFIPCSELIHNSFHDNLPPYHLLFHRLFVTLRSILQSLSLCLTFLRK